MVQSCAAVDCTQRWKKGLNLKFHRFPKNPDLRKAWLHAIERLDFNPKWGMLCEKHFRESDYEINVHGNRVLKKGSIPIGYSCDNDQRINVNETCGSSCNNDESINAIGNETCIHVVPQNNNNLQRSTCDDIVQIIIVVNEPVVKQTKPEPVSPNIEEYPPPLHKTVDALIPVPIKQSEPEPSCSNIEEYNPRWLLETVDASIPPQLPVEQSEPELSSSDTEEYEPSLSEEERRYPTDYDDFEESDLEDEINRKRFFDLSQKLVADYRKETKFYQSKLRRQKVQINKLNALLENLKKKGKTSSA